MTNKKAQAGPVTFIFLLIFFVIVWFLWLGEWVAYTGQQAVIDNNLVGLEAFIIGNFNLWILVAMVLGTMGYFYWSAR